MVITDLLDPSFLAADGRVFFYYAPLAVACFVVVPWTVLPGVMRMFTAFAAAVGVMFAFWSAGVGRTAMGGSLFTGFMSHKTSAGSLFAALAVLLVASGMEERRRLWLVSGSLMFIPTLFSGSRQALFGVASMAIWMLFRYRTNRRVRRVVAIVFLAFLTLPVIAPTSYERISRVANIGSIESARAQWQRPGWDPRTDLGGQLELDGGVDWNLVGRVLFMRRAWDAWLDSPVLGIGFGRFNDALEQDCALVGVEGIACLKTAQERTNSDQTAHNSYIHLLAELGIVGVAIFGFLFRAVWIRLRRAESAARSRDMSGLAAYLTGCQAVLMMLPGSALFGHAVGAPQVGIPILTMAGIAIAMSRTLNLAPSAQIQINEADVARVSEVGQLTPKRSKL